MISIQKRIILFLFGLLLSSCIVLPEQSAHATSETINNNHVEKMTPESNIDDSHSMPESTHQKSEDPHVETDNSYKESDNSENGHGNSEYEDSHEKSEQPESEKFNCTCNEVETHEEECQFNFTNAFLFKSEGNNRLQIVLGTCNCSCDEIEEHHEEDPNEEEHRFPKEAVIFPSAIGMMIIIFSSGYTFYFFHSRAQMKKYGKDHNPIETEIFKDIIFTSTLAGAAAPGIIGFGSNSGICKIKSPK